MDERRNSMESTFKAMVVEESKDRFTRSIQTRRISDLPQGTLLVRVQYSSLNYKDALSASGNRGVTKNYPHTPGIDAAGVVEASESRGFSAGDKVIVTSYDLGMNTSGGLGEYIRVPAEWAVPLPEKLTPKEAMILGTAGLTAGISVSRLVELVKPDSGEIIVSGATGGVGSVAVSILAALGYKVAALSGKGDQDGYLKDLGAARRIDRSELLGAPNRPLLKPQYAGGVDTVGGDILANIIKSVQYGGAVTACGNVASADLALSVYPFILRGVTLVGVDSQNYPMAARREVWRKLAGEWRPESILKLYTETNLEGASAKMDEMLAGRSHGRVIVRIAD
jgi:acrylyl-CoA reductase (NADPH)